MELSVLRSPESKKPICVSFRDDILYSFLECSKTFKDGTVLEKSDGHKSRSLQTIDNVYTLF
jgi:hypothetical protein